MLLFYCLYFRASLTKSSFSQCINVGKVHYRWNFETVSDNILKLFQSRDNR